MGCSSSVPSDIIPDPGDTEACVFTIKSTGMFAKDNCYARAAASNETGSRGASPPESSRWARAAAAPPPPPSRGLASRERRRYKGDSTGKKDRWFLLNKIKEKKAERAFEGERKVDLENFVRVGKKGEVLWASAFDSKPPFEMNERRSGPPPWAASYVGITIPAGHAGFIDATLPSGATVRIAVPAGSAPGQVVQVADPGVATPDGAYWQSGGFSSSARNRKMDKFELRTSARIAPGTRGAAFGEGFELQVYARGTSLCAWTWSEGNADQKHNNPGWTKKSEAFVDALHFNLVQKQTGQSVATWSAPGDVVGKGSGAKPKDVTQENPVFAAAIQGGWTGKSIRLETRPHWDPCLALIVAYLCSKEYCPEEINGNFFKFFKYPNDPPSGFGFGWGTGNQFGDIGDIGGMAMPF